MNGLNLKKTVFSRSNGNHKTIPRNMKLLIILITMLLIFICITQVEYANTSIEPLLEIETSGNHSPLLVLMNNSDIIVNGAKCSCGTNYNNYNRHDTIIFKNYCPFCKKYGVLVYNLKGNIVEGELSCELCSADFCIADGYEKSGNFRKKLIVNEYFSFAL